MVLRLMMWGTAFEPHATRQLDSGDIQSHLDALSSGEDHSPREKTCRKLWRSLTWLLHTLWSCPILCGYPKGRIAAESNRG
jgi:hypothetical protein